jgi:hypothetical protein
MAAIQVNTATKTIKVLWRGPAGAQGSPVIGGGTAYVSTLTGITTINGA